MKGITPIIATILLLLIVIAIIGFAFGIFQRIATTAGQGSETQVRETTQQLSTLIRIDNAQGTAVTIRNIGTTTINSTTLAIYVNTVARTCIGGWSPASIVPSAIASCTLSAACNPGETVRITSPGSEASYTCT